MFYLPLPKSKGYGLLDHYEKMFGTRTLIKEWWRQDFPFVSYFSTVSVIPSKDVTVEDLRRQKNGLSNMSHFTKKSYKSSFWCYCNSPRARSLRQRMMRGENFKPQNFLNVALSEWKDPKFQPYKVPFTRRIKRKISKLVGKTTSLFSGSSSTKE